MMKRNGRATVNDRRARMPAFSPKRYGKLLADALPRVISDDKEYDRLEAVANKLLDKGENKLTPEENQLFGLITNLLEDYEARTLPKLKNFSPSETLRFLMEENNLKQVDLEDVFGSQSAVSRALNGGRRIGLDQAKGLARRFNVSAELFI